MDLEKDVEKIENKVEKTSFAMEMLEYSKQQNKQLKSNFNISMGLNFVLIILLTISVGYSIYLLNDIGKVEDTDSIEIVDVETIDNTHIKIGDDIWEKSQ